MKEFSYQFFANSDMLEDLPMMSALVDIWRKDAEDQHLLVQGPAWLRVFTNEDIIQYTDFARMPPKVVMVIVSGPIVGDYVDPHADCPDWGYLHVKCQRCGRKYQCTPFDDYYCTPEGDHACGKCLFAGRKVAHIDLEAPLEEPIFVQYPPSPAQ